MDGQTRLTLDDQAWLWSHQEQEKGSLILRELTASLLKREMAGGRAVASGVSGEIPSWGGKDTRRITKRRVQLTFPSLFQLPVTTCKIGKALLFPSYILEWMKKKKCQIWTPLSPLEHIIFFHVFMSTPETTRENKPFWVLSCFGFFFVFFGVCMCVCYI